MALLFRILVGLSGLMSLLGTFQHWFRTDSLVAERGISAIEAIGRANIRADIGGIFLAIGLFMLLAAWKQSRHWAVCALIVVGSTFAGRVVSLGIEGVSSRLLSPMAIEAAVIAILVGALWAWKEMPEGL